MAEMEPTPTHTDTHRHTHRLKRGRRVAWVVSHICWVIILVGVAIFMLFLLCWALLNPVGTTISIVT